MGKTGENLHESSCFCTGDSRTFSTAKGGLFVFADFQPADRQARMGMAANVRERALDDIADSHIRKGRSPEKPQIFLYLYHADYSITTASDTSSPLWMVRTLGNSVGVAAAYGLPVYSCLGTGDSRTFFYRQRRTFCFCGFSACRQAGADGGGGECTRARSRRHCRQPQTQRAQP